MRRLLPVVLLFAFLLGPEASRYAAAAGPAAPARVTAVEFHHPGLDHYFVTAQLTELNALDTGKLAGWQRTGRTFPVLSPGAQVPGSVPVCRFYGRPDAGLNSHFYSANPSECQVLRERAAHEWQLEDAEAFRVLLPSPDGGCPAGYQGVHRLYNGRADVNHRYVTGESDYAQMLAAGYVAEGSGALPVVFCTPRAADVAVPECEAAADQSQPSVGGPVRLRVACTGSPSHYRWSGCASSGSECIVARDKAGLASYGVVAVNQAGESPQADVKVLWVYPAAAPMCSIESNVRKSWAGTAVVLTANCSNSPLAYEWTHCDSDGPQCVVSADVAGQTLHGVAASNEAGTGPRAEFSITWLAPGPGAPVCTAYPSEFQPRVGTALELTATCANEPSTYEWTGCVSALASCTVGSSSPSTKKYAVVATNSSGRSAPFVVSVDWQPPAPLPPACQVRANPANPPAGSEVMLVAVCTGEPDSWEWTNCESDTDVCIAYTTLAGPQTYSVAASNAGGEGNPASVTVTWGPPAVACTLAASSSTPLVGHPLTLTANCTGNPYIYSWTNCESIAQTCVASSTQSGSFTYAVAATGAEGSSAPAYVTVNWQNPSAVLPTCTISPAEGAPTTGTSVTLTASCTNAPTSYAWTNCTSVTSTCIASSSVAGAVVYGVSATNAAGTGPQALSVQTWQAGSTPVPPGAPVCMVTALPDTTLAVGAPLLLTASCTNAPYAYAWVGCASSTATCTTSAASPGLVRYGVLAANATGLSAQASVDITWTP